MNILIVEDDPTTLHRLQHFVEKWGHNVVSGRNGLEALEKFLSHSVDLVLTDWMMPEMDGLELVHHISGRGADAPYVYVIILTARGDKNDVVRALSSGGVDDYIVKPFDPDELHARINVGIRTVRLERTLRDYGRGLERIVRNQTAELRRSQTEIILRLMSALDYKEAEIHGHIRRVAQASALLAKAAHWPSDQVEDLRLASAMHDIGKIGLPDKLLNKDERFSASEFEQLKGHTLMGARIFEGSDLPMIQMARDIALSHHERWDGSGYPNQIAGRDIPAAARIVALVDVFDTLRHDPGLALPPQPEEILNTMKKGRGTHFDPFLFDVFASRLPDFMAEKDDDPDWPAFARRS
jgi:cyclic di-GMP phosphodiesterase